MWPKALAQLIELAPHIGRLLPLADRFLQSKAAGDETAKAVAAQLNASTDSLRSELGEVNAANAALARLVNEQAERTAVLTSDVRAARDIAERLQAEVKPAVDGLRRAEARIGQLQVLLLVNLAASFLLLVLAVALFLHLK
jgi:methyl-accepting chemotaxis protein